jgi:hypothetical protein
MHYNDKPLPAIIFGYGNYEKLLATNPRADMFWRLYYEYTDQVATIIKKCVDDCRQAVVKIPLGAIGPQFDKFMEEQFRVLIEAAREYTRTWAMLICEGNTSMVSDISEIPDPLPDNMKSMFKVWEPEPWLIGALADGFRTMYTDMPDHVSHAAAFAKEYMFDKLKHTVGYVFGSHMDAEMMLLRCWLAIHSLAKAKKKGDKTARYIIAGIVTYYKFQIYQLRSGFPIRSHDTLMAVSTVGPGAVPLAGSGDDEPSSALVDIHSTVPWVRMSKASDKVTKKERGDAYVALGEKFYQLRQTHKHWELTQRLRHADALGIPLPPHADSDRKDHEWMFAGTWENAHRIYDVMRVEGKRPSGKKKKGNPVEQYERDAIAAYRKSQPASAEAPHSTTDKFEKVLPSIRQ